MYFSIFESFIYHDVLIFFNCSPFGRYGWLDFKIEGQFLFFFRISNFENDVPPYFLEIGVFIFT
jgi:hypothetical protein